MTWHCKGLSCAAIDWRCRRSGERRETDSYIANKYQNWVVKTAGHLEAISDAQSRWRKHSDEGGYTT